MEWAALLLSIVPMDAAIVDHVDTCEINHVHNWDGELIYTQAIFWSWDGIQHRIVDWRMMKPDGLPMAVRDAIWVDNGELRVVRFGSRIETWNQYDIEVEQRSWLPKEKRRLLSTRGK